MLPNVAYYRSTYLHLFQLATRLRLQNIHDVHITMAANQGTLLWPSEDAALINDQRLVSEHACGVCIVLDHIISHTNIDVHTRLAHVRLVFHQTEQLRSCHHSHTCAVFGDIQSFEKCSLWSFGNHLTSFENMKPLRLTVWLWLHD